MAVLWIQGNCPRFPKLSDEQIAERLKFVQPVARFGETKHLSTIVPVDPRSVAFTWSPVQAEPLKDAFEVARIETYHLCGYIALFKPSIDEVLAQIPPHLYAYCKYFETLSHDDVVACFNQGDGHRTVTILYSDLPSWDNFQAAKDREDAMSPETKALLGVK
jgi:hypothetical protein